MAVNGHSRKLSDHIFNCNREVEREQELEVRWGCELSKPSTSDVPSPTRLYTTYPNSTTKWVSGAPTPEPMGGALLIQNTTVLITRSIWFWRGAYLDFFFLLFLDPAPSEVLILRSWLPAYLSQETTSLSLPGDYPLLLVYPKRIPSFADRFTFGSKESNCHQPSYEVAQQGIPMQLKNHTLLEHELK